MRDHKVCGSCAHWGVRRFSMLVTVPDRGPLGMVSRQLAPCLISAVDADAGDGAVVMLGPESHCRCHADAWQPSEDFRRELAEETDYGVRPGVDYPATLQRPVHAF